MHGSSSPKNKIENNIRKPHGFPFLKISKAKAMPLNFRVIIAPTFQKKLLSGFILSGSALYGELCPSGVSLDDQTGF